LAAVAEAEATAEEAADPADEAALDAVLAPDPEEDAEPIELLAPLDMADEAPDVEAAAAATKVLLWTAEVEATVTVATPFSTVI
jgi:hypothetical protein